MDQIEGQIHVKQEVEMRIPDEVKEVFNKSTKKVSEDFLETVGKKRKLQDGLEQKKYWNSYNQSNLREQSSTLLKQSLQKSLMKQNISQWTEEKMRISQMQKMQNEEQFKMTMQQKKEIHFLKLKLMKHKQEYELLLQRKLAEKEFNLKEQFMKEEHELRLKLIKQQLNKK
ncbi:uncharacterized protein [Halyomorpha halys]|uniref:uncharacterized protein isoform X2 n=1 Tax=Halyomorpha halys TaxID=286706 RepID=UPI0006D4DFC5|nr:uncharacterized protein LOC106679227 isoform X2 [Halyomorpha halys]